ncbi:MAG: glycosyltransferase, partial [Aggregatilineales bacterium]
RRFMATEAVLIAEEVAYIGEHEIQIVVADISPVAFEIAEVVDLPSVLITHFTWDFVYEQYVDDYPGYRPIIDHIQAMYRKAGLVLELPFAHDFSLFSTVEKHPLTINPISQSRDDVRALLNIPKDSPLVLLSMGGHQWGHTNLAPLREMTEKIFLVQPGAWEQVSDLAHFRQVPLEYDDYHNLIAAADLVVGKAGGSTVAEVIGHRTPMIYTLNDNWSENVLLQAAMDEYCNSLFIPWQDFEQGAWADHIDTLLTRDYAWKPIAIDGAVRAADRITAYASR